MRQSRCSQLATPGTPGYMADFTLKYDPDLAKQLLAKSGFGPDKPVKIGFATTNGQFPSDYDIARAITQMWKRVGIEADLQVIEYPKYFELNRGHKLPEATLYSFDNATGDPEIFVGYMLNPKLPFSPWQDMTLGQKVMDLFNVADTAKRFAGWQAIDREAMEIGAKIPLLQSVQTVVRQKNLSVTNTPTAGSSHRPCDGPDHHVVARRAAAQSPNCMIIVLLLARRVLTAVPILLIVSILLFVALRLLPVDPAAMSMPPNATIEDIEAKRHEMGLDQPLPAQYAIWLRGALHGDFGRSIQLRRDAGRLVATVAARHHPTRARARC